MHNAFAKDASILAFTDQVAQHQHLNLDFTNPLYLVMQYFLVGFIIPTALTFIADAVRL